MIFQSYDISISQSHTCLACTRTLVVSILVIITGHTCKGLVNEVPLGNRGQGSKQENTVLPRLW